MKPKYFFGLEWLRFLMALYMVTFHLGGLYPDAPTLFKQFVSMGFYATSTFLMLSGFLLAYVYLDSNSGAMKCNPKGFIAKRLCNLYPIHVITLVFALVVMVVLQQFSAAGVVVAYNHHPYASVEDTGLENLLPPVSWMTAAFNLVLQLFLLHSWEPRFLWLNGPSWSISVLLFFYLLFPFIGPRLMNVKHWPLTALAVWGLYLVAPVLADCLGAYSDVTVGILHRNPLLRLPEFVFGILLCRALKEPAISTWVERHCALLMSGGLLGIALGALLLHCNGKLWFYPLHNGLLLPCQGMLILACCSFTPPHNEKVKRLVQRLGEASLCIFAIQIPVIKLMEPLTKYVLASLKRAQQLAGQVGDAFSGAGEAVCDVVNSISIPIWLIVPHLLLIVLFGLLAQGYLVKPIRSWLENHLPPAWRYRKNS